MERKISRGCRQSGNCRALEHKLIPHPVVSRVAKKKRETAFFLVFFESSSDHQVISFPSWRSQRRKSLLVLTRHSAPLTKPTTGKHIKERVQTFSSDSLLSIHATVRQKHLHMIGNILNSIHNIAIEMSDTQFCFFLCPVEMT